MKYSTGRRNILCLLGLCLLLLKTGPTEAQSKRPSRVTSSRSFGTNVKPNTSNGPSFDCPEEFGYYPHPSDCTQYYVCVFGGALLESCTGGLMYSHDLQTCDWPRNVGCELVDTSSERSPAQSQAQSQREPHAQHVPSRIRFGSAFGSQGGTQKAATVPPQYHRSPPQVIQAQVQNIPPPPPELRVSPNPVITSRGQPKPLIDSQEDIAKLYADAQESLPPVEEEESDRQQRVYRGQPSTVSQVQRDRDGIIHQASINSIPQSGKIGSYAFGTAYRVESSSPSSLGAPQPANIFVQPTPAAPPQQLEPNRNYYNASTFNHGGSYQPQQQHQQHQQQQLQPTPFQQAPPQEQHQQQAQAPTHPYDSSYYSVYDDDIDLYRDIEYQQQQPQEQQQAPTPQYQSTVRQQQPHATYRPLELSATPKPPSYANQPAYVSDYDEDINGQIEQDNAYDQPTRAPQRAEHVVIQKLDTPARHSSTLTLTTPASPPEDPTYYERITTPYAPKRGPVDYAYGSAEDYDQSERTLTGVKARPHTGTDGSDLIANVVGHTEKTTATPPTRSQNTKTTPPNTRSHARISNTTTQAVTFTQSSTITSTSTYSPTTTSKLASSKAHANKSYKQHIPDKSKTTTKASSTSHTTTTSSTPFPNYLTYSSNPFLKSKLQHVAKSLARLVSSSQPRTNFTSYPQAQNLTNSPRQSTSSESIPDKVTVPAQIIALIPPPTTTQRPLVKDSSGNNNLENVEAVFDESHTINQTVKLPKSRSFETSTSAKFLDFINAAAYGTSPSGNRLNEVPDKLVNRDISFRDKDISYESSSRKPEPLSKYFQKYVDSDVPPQSFKVPTNIGVRLPTEEMESASTTRPSKPIQYSLQSGSQGFSLRAELRERNVSDPIIARTNSFSSTTTTTSPKTLADLFQQYVDIKPTTYAPPLLIWRSGRPVIQQAHHRPTVASSSTSTSVTTTTSAPTTSKDEVESSSTSRAITASKSVAQPSRELDFLPRPNYMARSGYLKNSPNRVTANPAMNFVSPYKSLENLLHEERQHQHHHLRTTTRPRYTNAPAFPEFLQTTAKSPKNLFMTASIRNSSQDVLATMETGNARNFSVSDAILSTFSPQRPAPSMLRTTSTTSTTTTTTTTTTMKPHPLERTSTEVPTTVSAVVASSAIHISQAPKRARGRSRYTAATSNSLGDSVDEPTTYAPKLRLPGGYDPIPFPKRKPQRVQVIGNQRSLLSGPTAKQHEKYTVFKDALQAKDSALSAPNVLSNSLKHKPIENEASASDEPRAEALISKPLEARHQNGINEKETAMDYSSTEHVVSITERPTVKFLYSNKYRQQTAEHTLADSLQNSGYLTSPNGSLQKFRSANVLDQLRQFLSGSDSNSNSDESGNSQFVDEYSLPELRSAIGEIKQLYFPTDRPVTTTLKSSTSTLHPNTTPFATLSPIRSKAESVLPSLNILTANSISTERTTPSTPDFSTPITLKAPPVSLTTAPTIPTATATPSPFAPHTARASRVNNVIKSSIAAAALGPSTSTYQPPVSAGKTQKFKIGFATNNKNHQLQTSSVNQNGPAASASVKCSDSTLNAKCNEISSRNSNRNRGSAMYSNQDRDLQSTPNRGTHPPRTRPTLKPSGTIVSKAQEFVDIYRYPPTRPDPIYPQPTPDKTAAKCRKDVCLLPDCYCGGRDIPGELPVESIPQIVLLTFDDSVNDLNKQLYTDLFEKGRVNPNGCPITATFYVSHEWTDYSQVQNLYADGHEMASHTVSHSFGEQFSQKKWTREIAGQREILAAYGGVKMSDVRGMRAPFLSVGGNKMYKMLYDSNFTYDSSMPVYENRPPSWPYTLDYKIFHDCMIPPCPTRSYPGVWQVPMVMWQDLNGGRCSMGDACSNPSDADGVTKMIMKNFERHYTTNRAPFGLFYHAAWFTQPHHKEGFIKFLDAINAMQDVWIITNWQALQWVRDPTPISRINSFQPFQCDYSDRPKRCNNPKVCNLWHKSGVRYMKTCQPCPDIYPWTGKSGIRSSRIDNEVEEPTA
ncbi:mucin-5AC isoform X7 [Drosophila santomea]|uniref:mucin-5AC isoform X7 n=1 Tax=Drosophila santomea TaxID=129105 RepID=UPI001954EF91|nr:mucin-5AC isoform X7 [Drosophila santomea]